MIDAWALEDTNEPGGARILPDPTRLVLLPRKDVHLRFMCSFNTK